MKLQVQIAAAVLLIIFLLFPLWKIAGLLLWLFFSSFNQYQITGFREFLESLLQNTTGELIWLTVANVIQGFIAGMMAISLVKKIMGADILKKAAPISAGGLIALFFISITVDYFYFVGDFKNYLGLFMAITGAIISITRWAFFIKNHQG